MHVHHGGHFMWDLQVYVGRTVDIVDNYDLDKWSKVEIESICREFGYIAVAKLWFKMTSVNPEQANFHEMVDDAAAVFMTNLVKGYREIHVFVEHLVHESLKLPMEDFEPLAARQPSSEPEGVDALEVFVGDQQNEDMVCCVSNDSELQSDHYYEYAEYDNDNDNDDEEYKHDFSQFWRP